MFDLQNHPEWPHLLEIHKRFRQKNFEIYLVGGCVRDMLLGRKPKDFDFATSAKPEEMEALFESTNDIGKAFGTIQIVLDTKMYEVTTFRKDLDYKDGRHPTSVSFSNAKEDAIRRDFTINALFYDIETKKITDHVGGLEDLKSKTIRFIGDAKERIEEDKLRLLRALRFVSVLGFDLEPDTAAAIKLYAPSIKQVSNERIHEEMMKLISGDFFYRVIPYLRDTNILEIIYPGVLDQTKIKDFLNLSRSDFLPLQMAFGVSNTHLFGLLFFSFLLNNEPSQWREWRWSKQLYSSVLLFRMLQKKLRSPLSKGEILHCLQSLEGNMVVLVKDALQLDPKNIAILQELYADSLPFESPLPEPLINGKDLLRIGVTPGSQMGKILEDLYLYQIENNVKDKKQLLERAHKNMK